VLANKAHHTTAECNSGVDLADQTHGVFERPHVWMHRSDRFDVGWGPVRHVIHAGCHVPHTASLSMVTFHGLHSCTWGCSSVPLVLCWCSALPLCCTCMKAAVRRRGDAMTAQVCVCVCSFTCGGIHGNQRNAARIPPHFKFSFTTLIHYSNIISH
jgi:hypothetical protein